MKEPTLLRPPPMGRVTETTVVMTAAAVLLCTQNQRRRALILSNNGTTAAWVSIGSRAASGVGVQILPTTVPVVFKLEDVGSWVQAELWAFGAATATLEVVEVSEE